MELTSLDLYRCYKLTGVFGLGWGMVGGVKIGNRLRPQGNIQRTYPGTFFISPHTFPQMAAHPGNIEVFKDMPIEKLNLKICKMLTGEWARNLWFDFEVYN